MLLPLRRPPAHIGGLILSFSAVTRAAVKLPSGFFSAKMITALPGFKPF